MQKQLSEGFFKKSSMNNFAEFIRKHLRYNLFFDKVINLVDMQLLLKTSL